MRNISNPNSLLIHTPLSVSQSFSLSSPNSLTHTLYFTSLSLISHLWQSHQLLHPKVTAHTQYFHSMLNCVMESKTKRFSNFISQIPQNIHSKYPNDFVRLQSFKASLFSSLSSSLRSLRSWSEMCIPP